MSDRVRLFVDDAAALAERCWDAGFTVRAGGSSDGGIVVMVAPLDLEVEITSRPSDLAGARPRVRARGGARLAGAGGRERPRPR
jgi:hypothetical protein